MKPKPIHKSLTKRVARGAGSINCDAEVMALAQQSRFIEAIELGDRHDYMMPNSPLRKANKSIRDFWRSYFKGLDELSAKPITSVPS